MDELSKKKCEACRVDAPLATQEQIDALLPQIPDWDIVDLGGIAALRRTFEFDDFSGALSFTNRVGLIAEEEQHHPAILTEWGKVTVTWWTHKIGGLHVNDFIMAAKTDKVKT